VALGAVENVPALEVRLQGGARVDGIRRLGAPIAGGEALVVVLEIDQSGAGDLSQVAGAGGLMGPGAELNKRGGQQGGENDDDAEHHQQLNESEAAKSPSGGGVEA
jgi:hypothetical protein